jgi:hypothetical protein
MLGKGQEVLEHYCHCEVYIHYPSITISVSKSVGRVLLEWNE